MTAGELIAEFQVMLKEGWKDVWGAAEKGSVDCSGAFVYAFREHGLPEIYHGSNTIARKHVVKLLPISEAKPGMAAFKVRKPGDAYYNLPDKFAGDPDQNDYYHIGLVDENPKYVLNAQSASTGFQRSDISRKWTHCAYLKDIDYGETPKEEIKPMPEKATVSAPNGSTVNMRASASIGARLVERVPVGSEVTIMKDDGQWCHIVYDGKQGWMLSNYLNYSDSPEDVSNGFEYQEAINKIAPLINQIRDIIDQIPGGVG